MKRIKRLKRLLILVVSMVLAVTAFSGCDISGGWNNDNFITSHYLFRGKLGNNPDAVAMCLVIQPKSPMDFTKDEKTFENNEGGHEPFVSFGDDEIEEILMKWYEWYNSGNHKVIPGKFYIDLDSSTMKVYYEVPYNPSPSRFDEGRIQAIFMHRGSAAIVRSQYHFWYFDITQRTPKALTMDEYYELDWVKNLR